MKRLSRSKAGPLRRINGSVEKRKSRVFDMLVKFANSKHENKTYRLDVGVKLSNCNMHTFKFATT